MTGGCVALVGKGSFVAKHVAKAASESHLNLRTFSHNDDLSDIGADDIVVNFGLHPEFSSTPYSQALDADYQVARKAKEAGARFVMLSTRQVYPPDHQWEACETVPVTGNGRLYGENKALSEKAIRTLLGPEHLILRLANVFGDEAQAKRRTFFGMMLQGLLENDTIIFDMAAETRRDFIPVNQCAGAILTAIKRGLCGTYNLGSGFPVRCGDIADWIILGYGRGRVVISRDEIRDEFVLDMTKWRTAGLPSLVTEAELRSDCIDIGRRLRNA